MSGLIPVITTGGIIKYEAPAVAIEEFMDGTPRIIYEEEGQRKTLTCDFVMGCDSRASFAAQIH